ncbi:MAG: CBS domain-containing protein [Gemmatimonadetes bacterium]|nr:CBS domain-containing protein [Gemmatimonadota bacterium]
MARYGNDFGGSGNRGRIPVYGQGGPADRGLGFGRGGEYGTDNGWVTGTAPGGKVRGGQERGGRKGGSGPERARDIMTENPESVTPSTTLGEVARRMAELDVGILPVVDDPEVRRLRGVVTDRDLVVRGMARGLGESATVAECMTPDVSTVNRNASIHQVMDVMRREQVRRVPVVDGEGRLVGIIAQADLAVSYAGLDPQREQEVEEVLERISEPGLRRYHGGYDRGYEGGGFADRLRGGFSGVQRGARNLINRARDIVD